MLRAALLLAALALAVPAHAAESRAAHSPRATVTLVSDTAVWSKTGVEKHTGSGLKSGRNG